MARTILIVEDDVAIVELLEEALAEAGYDVVAAMGEDALAQARALHPAMILLDLHMPGMDGAAVSRRLHADPRTTGIPVVLMSAHAHLYAAATTLPVVAALPKPFTLPQLYDAVAHWARVPEQAVSA
jgi:CheY-like chemotaxis protein